MVVSWLLYLLCCLFHYESIRHHTWSSVCSCIASCFCLHVSWQLHMFSWLCKVRLSNSVKCLICVTKILPFPSPVISDRTAAVRSTTLGSCPERLKSAAAVHFVRCWSESEAVLLAGCVSLSLRVSTEIRVMMWGSCPHSVVLNFSSSVVGQFRSCATTTTSKQESRDRQSSSKPNLSFWPRHFVSIIYILSFYG